MPNDNEIYLKLILDGKEAIVTLGSVGTVTEKLNKTLSGSSLILDNFQKELLQLAGSNEEVASSIADFIRYNQLSEKEISQVITSLRNNQESLALTSQEYKQHGIAIQSLTATMNNLKANQDQIPGSQARVMAGTGQMTQVLGQLGYAIGDADMFMLNFRMGMMSVANNIPMVVTGFINAKNAAMKLGTSIKAELLASLAGPGGLLLAINGLMFLLNVLPALFDKSTEAIEDQSTAVDELRNKYAKLTSEQMQNRIKEFEGQIAELEAKHPSVQIPSGRGQYAGTVLRDQTPEERFGSDLDRVNALEKQVKLLEEINLNRGIEEEKIIQIAKWREKIELMNNNPDSKNYWKKLVTDATSYEDAVKKLNVAIENYQKKKPKKEEKIPNAEELFQQEMERILPSSLFEALRPLGEEEPQMLPDVKLLNEEELQKLRINNIEDRYRKEEALADFEYQIALKKYQDYANFEEIRTELELQHSIRRKEIAMEEAEFNVRAVSQAITQIRSSFAEHTAAYKLFAVFQTIVDTYQAATSAYKSTAAIPLVGPFLAPVQAAAAIAFGFSQVANIEKTPMPGYARGGIVVGEKGPEVIAPMQDFASGQAQLIERTIIATESAILNSRPYVSSGGGNQANIEKLFNEQFKRIDTWQKQINFKIDGFDLKTNRDRVDNYFNEFEA